MATKLPRLSKKGYVLEGAGAQVLLFHGYTGSPYDLKPIALYLNRHDMAVSVPLLHGHGTSSHELTQVKTKDWLRQASQALAKLDKSRPIFLGGLSMGACLAIITAHNSQAIKALLLFSPALSLKLSAELLISATRLGIISSKFSLPKLSGTSDIADPTARQKCPSYSSMPLSGLLEFDTVRMLAREYIPTISIPIFMALGRHDNVINLSETSNYIKHNILARLVTKIYPRSQHVITLDYDHDILCEDLLIFINTFDE